MKHASKNGGQLRLYYRGISADLIGEEHGVTEAQFRHLADQTAPVIKQLNESRKGGSERYRDLPFNQEIARGVKDLAAELRDRTENLVVLGIGGSALGSMARNQPQNEVASS